MGFFSKPKKTYTPPQETEEEKETAAKKARLLETEGENNGALLNPNQGKSVRRLFG